MLSFIFLLLTIISYFVSFVSLEYKFRIEFRKNESGNTYIKKYKQEIEGNNSESTYSEVLRKGYHLWIRVITKLPNSEQSYKGKVKTHKYINRQNQSTTGKLWKPYWPWLGTCISKEMVGWIRFQRAKPPAFITAQRFRLSLWMHT